MAPSRGVSRATRRVVVRETGARAPAARARAARSYEARACAVSSQPPAEIRARRVRQVVIVEIAAREDRVDEGKAGCRAVAHRHRHGAIQLDHGRWFDAQQHVVKSDDLAPVRGIGACRVGVHCRDRRLQRVRADAPGRELLARPAPTLRRSALDSSANDPGRSSRIELTGRRVRAARRDSCSSIIASNPDRLGLRQQLDEQPSEADGLAGEVEPHQRCARTKPSSPR